jgi:hypothetical protein
MQKKSLGLASPSRPGRAIVKVEVWSLDTSDFHLFSLDYLYLAPIHSTRVTSWKTLRIMLQRPCTMKIHEEPRTL